MLWNAFFLALREIRRNVLRAFLTTLGIVIGVSAVVTMVTLGQGATVSVTDQVKSLGSNLVVVRPGRSFGPSAGGGSTNFKISDAQAIADQVVGVRAVAPVSNKPVSVVYLQENWSTTAVGSTPDYFTVASWEIAKGRIFSDAEYRTGRPNCVIGATLEKELFGQQDPLGAKIRVKSLTCEVIGVLKGKGQGAMGNDQDDTLVLPLTTLQRRLAGSSGTQDVGSIMVSAKEDANMKKLIADLSFLMRERRNIGNNEDDDFSVLDTKQIAATLSSTTRIMTLLLGAVAAVSLLVGGIGIMNIMLVSVTERTREIGIRLAIGALPNEVLMQFLVESVVLSAVGGLVGIALAFFAGMSISNLISIPFSFDPKINGIAFLFSAAVGVLFGYMPARRAAALDPIEALRHE